VVKQIQSYILRLSSLSASLRLEAENLPAVLRVSGWFLALFYCCRGIFYWLLLTGVFSGGVWRFDLMPGSWRVLCTALAIAYPVVACGLWMGARWGRIVWVAAAVFESLCLTVYSGYFIWNIWLPLLNLLFLSAYYGMNFYLRFLNRHRKKEESHAIIDY